jgi:magnesium chelatase subunit ChlI-like protein
MEANETGTDLPLDTSTHDEHPMPESTPKPYVLNPNAAIAKYWEKPLSTVATVPPLNLGEEAKERHRIFSLLLFALMRRFFNGNKNGSRGTYPWREKQREDDGRYTGSDIQLKRFSNNGSSDIVCDADMRIGEIRKFCKLQDESQILMQAAMTQLNLSARAYHRILKLARTIADLAGSEEIQSVHLAEALQYRPKLMLG